MMPFLCTMLALITIGVIGREIVIAGTAFVLLANWLAEMTFYLVTGDQHAWMFYIVADYLAGLSLVTLAGKRWPLIVVAIYAIQIVAHAAYGLSNQGAWAAYRYWWTLTYTGWAQLIVVMGGAIGTLYHHHGARLRLPPVQAVFARMGRKS